MNDLWVISCGSGLRDAINPCIFMACAVFIANGLWFKQRPVQAVWTSINFVLSYAFFTLVFNFGPAQILIFNKYFINDAKIAYFILGIGTFILGIIFVKDWFLWHQAHSSEAQGNKDAKSPAAGGLVTGLITSILALILSAMATIWPMNTYILIMGNLAFLKGQWFMVMPLLLGYVFCSIWPLYFVWAIQSIKSLRPALLKLVYAEICFLASSSVILMFK